MKTSNERIVMGIDPGYAIFGYAVVAAQGNELRMLTCGVITTPARLVLALRLQRIYERLCALVEPWGYARNVFSREIHKYSSTTKGHQQTLSLKLLDYFIYCLMTCLELNS
jgi:Crossover junction endodeoxyribonuclease RuvC